MPLVELDFCETCHLCNEELVSGAKVLLVKKESPTENRVLAHVHCAARVAAKIRANE
jgi:hypothetical protein